MPAELGGSGERLERDFDGGDMSSRMKSAVRIS